MEMDVKVVCTGSGADMVMQVVTQTDDGGCMQRNWCRIRWRCR